MTDKMHGGAAASQSALCTRVQHSKCRNCKYPRTDKSRFAVPDDKVDWKSEYPSYDPPEYTAASIIGQPWADPDKLPGTCWNKLDDTYRVDRRSFHGPYECIDSMPRNPMGRTGIKGRGCLGRFGPNHAADPIVTRWKRDNKGDFVKDKDSQKQILQFISIQRNDNKEWAIPGGMVDPGELVSVTLKREFGEEALNSLELDKTEKKRLEKELADFFKNGREVYRGYVDDPRNTDNSWMETVAVNFHDGLGKTASRFKLHSGDDTVGVKWMDINSDVKLYASHIDMIKKVVEFHNAHWSKSDK